MQHAQKHLFNNRMTYQPSKCPVDSGFSFCNEEFQARDVPLVQSRLPSVLQSLLAIDDGSSSQVFSPSCQK